MCGCKIGKIMKFKGTSGVSVGRVAAFTAGAAAGKAINGITNKLAENGTIKINKNLIALGKIGIGLLLAMKSKQSAVKDAAMGVAAVGGLELAQNFVPAIFPDAIGATGAGYNLPSSQMYLNGVGSRYSNMEERHVVAGPESQYTIDNDTAVAGIM